MNRPRSLMTAFAEGHLISRELRDMLNEDAVRERFERELAVLDKYGDEEAERVAEHLGRSRPNTDN